MIFILEATFINIDIHIIIILSLLFTLCFDLNLWCVLSYVCLRMICAAAVSCVSSLLSGCCCCGVLLPSNGCVLQDIVGHHHQEEYYRASGGARAEGGAPGD